MIRKFTFFMYDIPFPINYFIVSIFLYGKINPYAYNEPGTSLVFLNYYVDLS